MAELSRDLAEKVLAADTRNAITKVSESGQLTAAQRVAVTKAALPATAMQQARATALLTKWCSGERLSADELEEIRPLLESTKADGAADQTPSADAASPPPLQLNSEPPRRSRTGLKFSLPHYVPIYGVASVDTLKNWREVGKKKGEPPPLDDPAALATWWGRHMQWRVPDGILRAAQAPQPSTPPAPPDTPASAQSAPSIPSTPAATPPPQHAFQIDITSLVLEKDAEVLQARSLVAGNYQLVLQSLAGKGGDPVLAQRNWEKSQEVLRKVTKYAEERAVRARDLLPRDAVEHDLAKLAEQLRCIDESTERRVMELCPNLAPEARAEVSSALRKVSTQRQRALENIEQADDFTLAA